MILIPINTDAPIYHFPYACIGLIFTNIVCFLLTGTGADESMEVWAPWTLQRGVINPIQWISSNFVHYGFVHLIGNMVFLWGFGIVVEGKLGWWRFVLIYFAIGIAQCAIEQTLMLGAAPDHLFMVDGAEIDLSEEQIAEAVSDMEEEGLNADEIDEVIGQHRVEMTPEERADRVRKLPGSFGASSIVFGLLAVALVWAPKNELTILAFIIRVFTFETSIMAFSTWYIGLEFVGALFQGFSMTTPTLHLMGAVIGFGLGVLLLKRGVVDCEDWDLFAVWSGNYGPWARDMYGNRVPKDSDQRRSHKPVQEEAVEEKKNKKQSIRSEAAVRKKAEEIADLVGADDFVGAALELSNLRRRIPDAQLDEPLWKSLIVGLIKREEWDEAQPLMDGYIAAFPEFADAMRLRLAKVCLQGLGDSKQAMRVLKGVNQEGLSEGAREVFLKLVQAARSK